MKWTVIWRRPAQDDLATLWIDGPDSASIASAADRIDDLLSVSPLTVGESRGESTRILIEQPLAVLYDFAPDDRLVSVWGVFRFRTPDSP
jgi:hypothetical protein